MKRKKRKKKNPWIIDGPTALEFMCFLVRKHDRLDADFGRFMEEYEDEMHKPEVQERARIMIMAILNVVDAILHWTAQLRPEAVKAIESDEQRAAEKRDYDRLVAHYKHIRAAGMEALDLLKEGESK